jgi:hypothetical protein
VDGGLVRPSLKPISTKARGKESQDDDEGAYSTTPTAKEAWIPERLSCPPPPRKHQPSSRCHFDGVGKREKWRRGRGGKQTKNDKILNSLWNL